MINFKLSGFSDEIAENIDAQFEHLNRLGIGYFEPRGIDGTNISDISDEQCRELKNKMDKAGIKVSSIGSPIGKTSITDDFKAHIDKLLRTIEIAKKLETDYIRVFSFYIPSNEKAEDYRSEVMERMLKMRDIAKDNDIVLLHENEKGIYGDIASRCLDIMETAGSENLRAVFDPANFIQCGQKTFPDAYEMLKPYIEYMHIKDALKNGDVVPSGLGEGCVYEILKALFESGYNGFLSLEPHLGSFTGLASLEESDKMLSLEKSSAQKFTIAYDALMKIIERIDGNE